MTQTTDAVDANGVLKPTGDLHLREQQRVRLIVESLDEATEEGAPPVDGLHRIRRRQRLGGLLNYYARAA